MPWEDFYEGLYDEDEFGLTRSFRDPYRDRTNRDRYYDDDDGLSGSPEAQTYLKMAMEPAPSEKIYLDYLGRRPRIEQEEYRPSVGRRIGAGLLAGAAGAIGKPELGITLGQQVTRYPFERAFEEWKTQGLDISTRARLADAGKNRELTARRELARGQEREREFGLRSEREERLFESEEARRARQEESDRRAEEREERSERREERLEGREQRIEQGQQRRLESERAESAKIKAEQFIKGKFPEFFADLSDPDDYSLKFDLDEDERQRAINLIKQQEDVYRRQFGLIRD